MRRQVVATMLAFAGGCVTAPKPAPTTSPATAPAYASLDDSVTAVEEAYANIRLRHAHREHDELISRELRKTTAPTTRAICSTIQRAYRASESDDAVQVERLRASAIGYIRDYARQIGVNPDVLHELEETHAHR